MTQVVQAETELLVLGTDAPVGPGLLAGSDVPDQLVAARDGRIAGVAGTGHAHRSGKQGDRRPRMPAPWRHYNGPIPARRRHSWDGVARLSAASGRRAIGRASGRDRVCQYV